MNSIEKATERRAHKRYRLKEDAIVATSARLGQIVDISMGGLSFRYIAKTSTMDETSNELDIFLSRDDFYLEKVPFEKVSDDVSVYDSPFSIIKMRRFSVKFGSLTSEQKHQLERFLRYHTAGEA